MKSELKKYTAVFVDLRAFTHLTRTVEVEDIKPFISDYYSLVAKCCSGMKGVLVQFQGDGVLLVFDSTDHAEDAVKFCLKVRTSLNELIDKYHRTFWGKSSKYANIKLSYKIGVNTGPIYMEEYFGYGFKVIVPFGFDAVVSCLLCDVAQERVILISETTKLNLRQIYNLRPCHVSLKGITDKFLAWEID